MQIGRNGVKAEEIKTISDKEVIPNMANDKMTRVGFETQSTRNGICHHDECVVGVPLFDGLCQRSAHVVRESNAEIK